MTIPRTKVRKAEKIRDKDLDFLFSKVVRLPGRCVVDLDWFIKNTDRKPQDVRHSGQLQCSHRQSRRYYGTRWDLRNADPMCSACHTWFTRHPIEFEEWQKEVSGEAEFERNKAQARRIKKWSEEELRALRQVFIAQLKLQGLL